MKPFNLKIITPDGVKFSGECESLLVRTVDGDVEILADHTDMFCTVGVGRARLLLSGESRYGAAQGGTLTVLSGDVTLLPVTFEFEDEIDTARAEAARERAEVALQAARDKRTEDVARAKLLRALNRLSVAERK